jgi:hypothetical protein
VCVQRVRVFFDSLDIETPARHTSRSLLQSASIYNDDWTCDGPARGGTSTDGRIPQNSARDLG